MAIAPLKKAFWGMNMFGKKTENENTEFSSEDRDLNDAIEEK